MREFRSGRLVSIGEAMVELAPEGGPLYRQGFAGDTFNTIWHMGQLLRGTATCGFVTQVGVDRFSSHFVEQMAADGLDTSGVLRRADKTMGLYLIELDGVERSFHYWRNDSAARGLADDATALRAALDGAALIHVSGITLAILASDTRDNLFTALDEARRSGAIVSFDPNIRPRLWVSPDACRTAIRRMWSLTDIALPSFDDEAALWGDADPSATVTRIAGEGVAEIVVKDGARPVHACFEGQRLVKDTPSVSSIRDTTGAGDSFNAGYLTARYLGAGVDGSISEGQGLSAAVINCLGARADRDSLDDMRRKREAR